MKVTKLGIEWGAAFEEAEARRITHLSQSFDVFITETHDVCLELPADAVVTVGTDRSGATKIYVTLRT